MYGLSKYLDHIGISFLSLLKVVAYKKNTSSATEVTEYTEIIVEVFLCALGDLCG